MGELDLTPPSSGGFAIEDEGPGFMRLNMLGRSFRIEKAWTEDELAAVVADPAVDDRTRSLAKQLRGVQAERNLLKKAVLALRAATDDYDERDCDCRYDYD